MGTAPTARAGWWAESTSDGGSHYGVMQADGVAVHSVCGRLFVPLLHPWTGEAERQHQPADPEHACPACEAALS